MSETQSNPQLELARHYVLTTRKNIYLTGKAGTGKTTFLRQLSQQSLKRMAIVAPTGVAAINAGGMTIHSLFQLPFGPFVPGHTQEQRKFTREKIRLIQGLDLLVIDEISMVRADLLDAIDDVLRRYRRGTLPFGGVQLLMIGDLHQLPPVVKDEEWQLLRQHYQTLYFFGSHALQQSQHVTIELQQIFRQRDPDFVTLLNSVRDNRLSPSVLARLNARYIPDFSPSAETPYITLTSHNATASDINAEQLSALKAPEHQFKASIEGDFPAFAYPTEETLLLKAGAQVMFVKNDPGPMKRYFNGKLGQIERFDGDTIFVKCDDDPQPISVLRTEWCNQKYRLDESTKEITQELLGTFTQYPLRLAWAITIHKSQGLTFDRVIIDAAAAFAHGQVYVALSRCKSLEGIVLRSPIAGSNVKTDMVVRTYSEAAEQNAPDVEQLAHDQRLYQQGLLRELFAVVEVNRTLRRLQHLLMEHGDRLSGQFEAPFADMVTHFDDRIYSVARKFLDQLEVFLRQPGLPDANVQLQERLQKAAAYFIEQFNQLATLQDLVQPLTDNKDAGAALEDAQQELRKRIFVQLRCLQSLEPQFNAEQFLMARTKAELEELRPQRTSLKMPQPCNLFQALKTWRENMAADHDLAAYEVLHMKTLVELSQKKPENLQDLKRIKGIGAMRLRQFGDELLRLIQTYK
jgi:PIF1-like helicase/HRDC domain/UvrD-like helicase C-terminal domain